MEDVTVTAAVKGVDLQRLDTSADGLAQFDINFDNYTDNFEVLVLKSATNNCQNGSVV